MMNSAWFLSHLVVAALSLPVAVHAALPGAVGCGELQNAFGPFDYRTVPNVTRHVVEDVHFTPGVESLTVGATGPFGGDIDYTLRAFPNSPRALLAMSKLALKNKSERPQGAKYTAECYFDRAIRFQPNDPMPRVLYAHFLKSRNRVPEARQALDEAERVRGQPSGFDLDYNLGLLYFDTGQYDKAAVAAQRAYALGAPLPALARKLKSVGKWKDAPVTAADSAPTRSAAPGAPTESNN